MHADTVRTWRNRFAELGMPGLADRKQTGRPPSFTPRAARAKALACQLPAETGAPLARTIPELWIFLTDPDFRTKTGQVLHLYARTTWRICSPGSTGTPPITRMNPSSHWRHEQPPPDFRSQPLRTRQRDSSV
ncbi:helix-turn-helix domain-containing protein [Streptomyces tubbatahanensis]|uniref:Helix-turn-helix domain-containing protein n=1 Tax=Streptomyces tubbatahanensis TaxID=2923272 RepID=A0ABY3XKZ3_9ACTN|nr:helix-turn-helix domain-containing protein [Streptomyces tubbatahanensis]UNS95098.1 helix-turn-helix domain-containing protein [Streptomyces tubbatahanensis]